MDNIIEKYEKRLVILKENRLQTVESNSDSENELSDVLIKQVAEFVRDMKASRDSRILSAVPSADNGLYWKDEYDRAVNEISELQAQLYDAEEEIRGLQNEIKRGIAG